LAVEERAAVLAHVSQCGHCRELLAVIAPDEGPPTQALLLNPKRQRNRWSQLGLWRAGA